MERVKCVCMYRSGGKVKEGDCRLFYDVTEDHAPVAVVGVGSCDPEVGCEDIDVRRQNIRNAAAGNIRSMYICTCVYIKNISVSLFISSLSHTHVQISCNMRTLTHAVGVKTLQKAGVTEIAIDSLGNAQGTVYTYSSTYNMYVIYTCTPVYIVILMHN